MGEVVVVRTGTANLASVLAALQRAGAPARVSDEAADVERAARVVLPGVGAFGSAMAALDERGLREAIRDRIEAGRPLLGICLGMQVLCEGSEESPGVPGLCLVPGVVRRFGEGVKSPQLGWNRVTPRGAGGLVREGYAYFANSYRLAETPPGWSVATADHGGEFVAAIQRGAGRAGGVLACQFHPELSGAWGLQLIRRWLDAAAQEGGGRC